MVSRNLTYRPEKSDHLVNSANRIYLQFSMGAISAKIWFIAFGINTQFKCAFV